MSDKTFRKSPEVLPDTFYFQTTILLLKREKQGNRKDSYDADGYL